MYEFMRFDSSLRKRVLNSAGGCWQHMISYYRSFIYYQVEKIDPATIISSL